MKSEGKRLEHFNGAFPRISTKYIQFENDDDRSNEVLKK